MAKDKKIYKRELPFDGKLITWDDPASIGSNFQQLTNMRYADKHLKGVGGMTKITTDKLTPYYYQARSAIHYTKDQPAESHILVQALNTAGTISRIYDNETAIPDTGDFDSDFLHQTTGTDTCMWSLAPDGDVIYCNNAENAIWGGNEREVSGFINYDPDDSFMYDYTERVRNTKTDSLNEAVLHLNSSAAYFYVGSIRPLDSFKLYMNTANSSTSTMSVAYWNGASWTSVSDLTDGTSILVDSEGHGVNVGISLKYTGTVSFSSTANSAKIKYIEGIMLYWYRVIVTSVSANTSIYHVTVSTPFQNIKDIWDGVQRQIDSFQLYDGTYEDYTVNVREKEYIDPPNYEEDDYNAGNFVNIGDCELDDEYFLCGFTEKMIGVMLSLAPKYANSTANDGLYIDYWNGDDWESVDSIEDGTYSAVGGTGARTLANTGTITWSISSPENEQTRSIFNDVQLYYYRFRVGTGGCDGHVRIFYVSGIPAQKELSTYKFATMSNDRIWLCCDAYGKKNSAICSAMGTSCVFNGDDSAEWEFGSEEELTAGSWVYSQYGSSLYYTTLLFKKNETWALVGNNPEDWVKYKISNTIGCIAPDTVKNVDLGPESNAPNRNVVIWQGANGIYMSDGRTPMILSQDIRDKFDKRLSTSINPDRATYSQAFWDSDNNCYHWLFASGSSTSLNKEFVFDFNKMAWFEISRLEPTDIVIKNLQLGIEVKDTSGNTYNYAFNDIGYMFRLEYGNDFNGNDIVHTIRFGDIALSGEGSIATETVSEYTCLIAVAKETTTNSISITHYGDGGETGTSWTESPKKSGYRIIYPVDHRSLGSHIFHSYKITITTNDEDIGFEPLYYYILYVVTRDHLIDYR